MGPRRNYQAPIWPLVLLSLELLSLVPSLVYGSVATKKFEYKYSFKPPYLSQKDGSVPFWEHTGSKGNSVILIQL